MSFFHLLPRKGAAIGGVALLLGLTPQLDCGLLRAGEPRLLVAPDQSPRDWLLTNQARRALIKDEQLAAANLGVSIKDRVATLWGTIPNVEIARRAEETLRKIGVVSVVNECRVVPAEDPVPRQVADAVRKYREQNPNGERSPRAESPVPSATQMNLRTSAKPNAELVPPVVTPLSPPAVLLDPVAGRPPVPMAPLTSKRFGVPIRDSRTWSST